MRRRSPRATWRAPPCSPPRCGSPSSTIAAPFSGTLGFRSVSEGAYVNAGTPLVQLDKVDRLQVSFSVPELQQEAVEAAKTVEVVADAAAGRDLHRHDLRTQPGRSTSTAVRCRCGPSSTMRT